MRDSTGKILGASKIARDIASQKQAQARQNLLLREMNHRIKNLFSVTAGLVNLSARSASDPRALATDLNMRLQALARAHELTMPALASGQAEQSTTLHSLLRAILTRTQVVPPSTSP